MTSQDFWSASSTKVILSPSALTVPLRVLSGAGADALPISSGLAMVSCAMAVRLNVRQTARIAINSFFIVFSPWLDGPAKLKLLLVYEAGRGLDAGTGLRGRSEKVIFHRLLFPRHDELRGPEQGAFDLGIGEGTNGFAGGIGVSSGEGGGGVEGSVGVDDVT